LFINGCRFYQPFYGGFRSVVYTDVVQAILMIIVLEAVSWQGSGNLDLSCSSRERTDLRASIFTINPEGDTSLHNYLKINYCFHFSKLYPLASLPTCGKELILNFPLGGK